MSKTIVFSWKIDNSMYGYLCGPETDNDTPMICERITTDATLKEISNKVSTWDESEYSEKFVSLKNMIQEYTQGPTISGGYSDYYYNNSNDKNYIVLTGKDGSSCNMQTGLNQNTADEITTYINTLFSETNDYLTGRINGFIASASTKIEQVNQDLTSKIESATTQIESQNDEMLQQLEDAAYFMSAATKVFELEGADITVPKLNMAIENSTETKIWKDSAEKKINEHDSLIEYCRDTVENDSTRINMLSAKVDNYRNESFERIAIVANEVENINRKVEKISSEIESTDEEETIVYGTEPDLMRKIEDAEVKVCDVDTIDNNDGTFDVNFGIGNENFGITVFGYGKKLKNNSNERTNGLILANNGFKYCDTSGSFISLINGNITLSNNNGSGKIEIKKDGVYINGKKQ